MVAKLNWKILSLVLVAAVACIPVVGGASLLPSAGTVKTISPSPVESTVLATPDPTPLPAPISEPTAEPTPVPTPEPTPTPVPQPTPVPSATPNRSSSYLPEISRCVRSSEINLSFDGGAGAQSIERILATLSEKKVKGTFFLTGKWVQANVAASQAIRAGGHEIYNHTWSHTDYNSAGLPAFGDDYIRQQFRLAEQEIVRVTGVTSKPYFRPPYGARDARVLQIAWNEGYRSVFWTLDALDWQAGQTEDSVFNRISQKASSGMILMMHIGDDITGSVLGRVIDHLRGRGFSPVSLTKCVST